MSFDYAAYRAGKFAKANPALLNSLTAPLEAEIARLREQCEKRLSDLVEARNKIISLEASVSEYEKTIAALEEGAWRAPEEAAPKKKSRK